MNTLNLSVWSVGFLHLAETSFFFGVVIAILMCALVLLAALGFLDVLPLGVHQHSYGIAALVGGVVSVALTRFMQHRQRPEPVHRRRRRHDHP